MKFQIVYMKNGYPLTAWVGTEENARRMAAGFRKAGYDVSVWIHTEAGARKTDI